MLQTEEWFILQIAFTRLLTYDTQVKHEQQN